MKAYSILVLFLMSIWANNIFANEPDSAFILSYSTDKNHNHNGMHLAWSIDKKHWHSIGEEYSFLKSDFGSWGSQKKMFDPSLYRTDDGLWHCLFGVNTNDAIVAYASSKNLTLWEPQLYPETITEDNCLDVELSYNKALEQFDISWRSNKSGADAYYTASTKDFRTISTPKEIPEAKRLNNRVEAEVNGELQSGIIHKVEWAVIDHLIKECQLNAYKDMLHGEKAKDDLVRFHGIKDLNATISVSADDNKAISDMLIGIFFEDINYAADGGLYAEQVQNRDFEYDPSDTKGRDKKWDSYRYWSLKGENATFTVKTDDPLHINNPHYAIIKTEQVGAALVNDGFDGIVIKEGEKYNVSLFARQIEGGNGKILARLVGKHGANYGEALLGSSSSKWEKLKTVIKATDNASDVKLEIIPQKTGSVALDVISLFPQKTFKGRKNGLRADLAQTIADMKPRFVRFPGGCVAHGDGIDNIYDWKKTIGPIEARVPQRNIWNYHQTGGLGYFEYFQFCEDIDAEPIPVVAAGVPCQNSSTGGHGQQGGIPMCDMDDYIQDVLDLIEWANGDAKSTWGRIRAEAGHPKPFNLKYVGIGNEDLISEVFEERFTMIFNAVREKYPEITVIGTVGPFYKGSDYEKGWDIAEKLEVPMVDEHYYESPGWFIHNQNYYDKYDRSKPKVYLGEYASHLPGRPNNIETALSEALYLTALERNGDIVHMTSYAPLLAKEGRTQWTPDLIYFNNTEVKPTVGYYVQKLYGNNSGETYYSSTINLSNGRDGVSQRVGVSVVRDTKSNDLILKLVNMLPVSVNADIKLDGLGSFNPIATKTVLTGNPTDKIVKPFEDIYDIAEEFFYELPAYSFTVIRIKTQEK